MSEELKEVLINPAPAVAPSASEVPAAEGDGESKKGKKKAEAKAKKEAEKARKAAEREAAAKTSSASAAGEDLAKDNYGDASYPSKITAQAIPLKDLADEHVGKTIKFRGILQQARKQGAKMVFLELRASGSFGANVQTIQALVVESGYGEAIVSRPMVKWTGGVSLESWIEIQAIVKKPVEPVKSASISEFELQVQKIYLEATAPTQLGVTYDAANRAASGSGEADAADAADAVETSETSGQTGPAVGFSKLLDTPAMRFRATLNKAISKVRRTVEIEFRNYMEDHDFVLFHPPALIGAASEGGANVFGLNYFDAKAFLAQSPQFYKQMKIAGGERRVYCIAPVFRAENSMTPRHMTEFIGLDMEMEIDEDYHEVLRMLQGALLHIFGRLAEKCQAEIEFVRTIYPSEPFLLPEPGNGQELVLTFAEGQKLLREKGPKEFANVRDDEDMSTPQEKALGALIRKEYNTDFYVLDKFPTSARPFYAYTNPANPKVTNAYDFFMRGQEILSGGQRYHKPAELEESIRTKGADPNSSGLKEYVDVFRSVGCPPHGGGGIGLDRIVAWYLNLPNVQMVADFPRTPNRLFP